MVQMILLGPGGIVSPDGILGCFAANERVELLLTTLCHDFCVSAFVCAPASVCLGVPASLRSSGSVCVGVTVGVGVGLHVVSGSESVFVVMEVCVCVCMCWCVCVRVCVRSALSSDPLTCAHLVACPQDDPFALLYELFFSQ